MKAVYIFVVILVLMLGVSSYFLNSVQRLDSITGTMTKNTGNLLTGYATGGQQDNPLNPVLVVSGDVDSCFIYRVSCPDETKTLFKVPDADFGFIGGSHVMAHNNLDFSWRMCCKNILDVGGDRDFALFHTSQELMTDANEEWGAHTFDTNSLITRKDTDPKIGNYIEYTDENNCSEGYKCIIKTSPLETNNYDFYNSHIWPCDTTFNTINMTSICYKPESETNCQGYEYPCDWEGIAYVDDIWVYCSFGLDDEQIPAYPNAEHEEGICCAPGEVKTYDSFIGAYVCSDFEECGFGEDTPLTCYLPNINPLTEEPVGYFEEEYFNQEGCVNWETEEACCYNIEKFGEFGNWDCPINSFND
jgi:hypothetical protein